MSTSPRVWSRFTRCKNGKELKFRIQEVPKDKVWSVYEVMFDYYITEEPVHKASKMAEREESYEEFKQGLKIMYGTKDYHVDACCLDDGSDDLKVVAASVMAFKEKGEASNPEAISVMAQTEEVKTFFKICDVLNKKCDVMKKYDLDTYYDDRGLAVHPEYRGLGIATELFKARVAVSKEQGIPITAAWMASVGSQKAAAKLGWETICEVEYEELGKELGVQFEGAPPSIKMMIFKT